MAIYDNLINEGLVFNNNIPIGTSFIMYDGKFLDILTSKNMILKEEKQHLERVIHPILDEYLVRKGFVEEFHNKQLVLTDNAIALNDGTNFNFECPYFAIPEQRPTEAQFNSLLNWLSNLSTFSKRVFLSTRKHQKIMEFWFQTLDNPGGWLPEDIIKEVKKTYTKETVGEL